MGHVSGDVISKHELDKRPITVELFESLLNVFVYTLELKLVDKNKYQSSVDFYKPKTGEEIASMSVHKQLQHIFVCCTTNVWARLLQI